MSQAWYRKIQKLGLAKKFLNKDSENESFMFLDHTKIKHFFAFELLPIIRLDDRLIKFAG